MNHLQVKQGVKNVAMSIENRKKSRTISLLKISELPVIVREGKPIKGSCYTVK